MATKTKELEWKYTYDGQSEYIKIKGGGVTETIKIRDNLMIDLDKNHEIIGVEILDSRK